MKFLGSIFVALLVAACAKNGITAVTGQANSTLPKDVSTMAMPEALATKYDSAALTCSLWTRMHTPLVIADTPDQTVSLDLIKNSSVPQVINMAGTADIHSISVQITLNQIEMIPNGASLDNYGAEYTFKNSPRVSGVLVGQSFTTYPSGNSGGRLQDNDLIFDENVPRNVVAEAMGVSGEPTVDYVQCTVLTKAKPLYQNQWKQNSAGQQPWCLLGTPANPSDCLLRRTLNPN